MRAHLARLQEQLRARRADVKWVEEANLHFTVRFLGEISEDTCRTVETVCQEAVVNCATQQVRLSGVGAFPNLNAPRVVWVGLTEGAEPLGHMAATIEKGLVMRGLPKAERPFSAHITIGRVRSPKNLASLTDELKRLAWTPPAPFLVDHLTLFRSELSSAGPKYSVVNTFRLTESIK